MGRDVRTAAVRVDSERLKAVLAELGGEQRAAPDDSPSLEIAVSLERSGGGRRGRRSPPS
jgi:hypothetical protein